MIKNLLYSLFLHFLLLLIIYINFNLKNSEENNNAEITVSLLSLSGDENSPALKPSSNVEEKKEPTKKEEITIPEKTKVKKIAAKNKSEEMKKAAPSKITESIKKIPTENKAHEFKPIEKAEKTKEKIAESTPKDDEKQSAITAKEKAMTEEEVSNKTNSAKNDYANLSNSLDNLDLSAREKFNIQLQLRRCYRKAIEETKLSSKVNIMITAKISESGYIDSNIDEITDLKRYNNPLEKDYKIAVDNVKRAIDLCSPLRNLPLDKYYIWKEVVLQFDEEEKSN